MNRLATKTLCVGLTAVILIASAVGTKQASADTAGTLSQWCATYPYKGIPMRVTTFKCGNVAKLGAYRSGNMTVGDVLAVPQSGGLAKAEIINTSGKVVGTTITNGQAEVAAPTSTYSIRCTNMGTARYLMCGYLV